MTTVAYKNGAMAADSQLTCDNRKTRVQKIVRLPDGGIASGCGLWVAAYAGLKFLAAGGCEDDAVLPNIEDATLLIAKPDGSLWVLDGRFPAYPILDTVYAIGCGSEAALMAMAKGDGAVSAVLAAIDQDALCGSPVHSMEIIQPLDYPSAKTHRKKK